MNEEDEEINLLDVVKKKIMRERSETHKPKSVIVNIHCGSLKSMFIDHETSITVVEEKAEFENPINQEKGFISSHIIEKLSDGSIEAGEVIDEKELTNRNEQLITKDIIDECIKEFSSAKNSKDILVIPSELSLATTSRKFAKKNQIIDSIIPS